MDKPKKKAPTKYICNAADELAISKGARFDSPRGEHMIETVQQNFRLYEGTRWAGKLIVLMDWEIDFFMRLFSWVVWSDFLGMWVRRFKRARLWVPKKNGKSPIAAMVGLYLTVADGEIGGKTYSAAKDGGQAGIVHAHAIKMVEQSPRLLEECIINKTTRRIIHIPTDSWYGVIAGDNIDSQEGLNGNAIIDEGHVVDSRLAGVLEFMGASRDEALELMVSTAGKNKQGWGKQQWDYGELVNSGKQDDISFLHQVYAAPQNATDAQLEEKEMWYRVNPSLGHIINPEVFEQELKAAKRTPAAWQRFKMYRFNIWGSPSTPWLDKNAWGDAIHEKKLSDFAGCDSYLGLDMSLSRDMTGAVLIVPVARTDYSEDPAHEEAKIYYQFPLLWITRKAADRWAHENDYEQWAHDGHLRIIDGQKIDFAQVRRDIIAEFGETKVNTLSYDETYAVETAEILEEELGCERVAFRQQLMEFAEPTQMFERLLMLGLLRHPNNGVLNWMADNVEVTTPDRSGNYRPVKPQSSDKSESREANKAIDGIIASVMALREARKYTPETSIYETGGMLAL